MSKFDWESVNTVIPTSQAVAIHEGPRGDIVIRQEDSMGDDDHIIILPRSLAHKVVEAILDIIEQ